jgi:hypothetical protein
MKYKIYTAFTILLINSNPGHSHGTWSSLMEANRMDEAKTHANKKFEKNQTNIKLIDRQINEFKAYLPREDKELVINGLKKHVQLKHNKWLNRLKAPEETFVTHQKREETLTLLAQGKKLRDEINVQDFLNLKKHLSESLGEDIYLVQQARYRLDQIARNASHGKMKDLLQSILVFMKPNPRDFQRLHIFYDYVVKTNKLLMNVPLEGGPRIGTGRAKMHILDEFKKAPFIGSEQVINAVHPLYAEMQKDQIRWKHGDAMLFNATYFLDPNRQIQAYNDFEAKMELERQSGRYHKTFSFYRRRIKATYT